LADLDARAHFLQVNSIEKSTRNGYVTGARDYITFCIKNCLPLDPTPQTLARYIAYTSLFIASGPKYLTGARHFLKDLYPDFATNRTHPLVQVTISGSKLIQSPENFLCGWHIFQPSFMLLDKPKVMMIFCSSSSFHVAFTLVIVQVN
jgi:hypothetical protein